MPAGSCAFIFQCLFSIYTSLEYSVISPLNSIFEKVWGYLIGMPELYRITLF